MSSRILVDVKFDVVCDISFVCLKSFEGFCMLLGVSQLVLFLKKLHGSQPRNALLLRSQSFCNANILGKVEFCFLNLLNVSSRW